ncbi:MAG: cytochrome c4 [Betaproteobacteria bacterium]|nr:cytochrome c4 [Betaproteobacteria bacterium]
MNLTRLAGDIHRFGITCRRVAVAVTVISVSLHAGAEAPDRDGTQIATTVCAACHGMDGNSMIAANPHLAQQSEQYIAAQLAAYKSGARVNPIMQGMAAGLTPGEMKAVGAYFAKQRLAKPAIAKDKKLALEGQQIWRAGIKKLDVPACAGCHGPAGAGIPAQYPRVAGQWGDYTLDALKQYAAGTRKNVMMQPIAQRLSEGQMKALSEYMAGLR